MGNMKTMLLLFSGLTMSLAFSPPRQLAPPLTSLCSSSKSVGESSTILFRPARAEDQGEIRRILLGMMMNPLSVDARNFLCADEGGILVGFGQVKAIGEGNFELASVHVSESHRRRGIGSNLVRQLVKDFATTHGPEQLENLYLITLTQQVDFYKKLGFEVIADKDAPTILRAEQAVGSVLQFFAGNPGVCTMRATSG